MDIVAFRYARAQSLQDFADEHGLVMQIGDRGQRRSLGPRFTAEFRGVEVKEGNILKSVCGEGNSPASAIADYADKLSRCYLVFSAYSEAERRLFFAGDLTYDPATYDGPDADQEGAET